MRYQKFDETCDRDIPQSGGCSIANDKEAVIELRCIVKDLQIVREYFGSVGDKCGQGVVFCAMDTIQRLADVMEAELK